MAELIQLGDFITAGEERTAAFLRDNLPATWQVIANKMLPLPNGQSREIDFIVIGKHRLFVIDEKGFHGRIDGTDQTWILGSRESRSNPLNKMEWVARAIAGYVRQRVRYVEETVGGAPFVEALVILSNPDVELYLQDLRRSRIVKLADSAGVLTRLDNQGRESSIEKLRGDIATHLNLLHLRPSLPRTLGTYRIQEELDGGPYYRAFLAEQEKGGAQAQRRLKLYQLDGLNEAERAQQKQLIYRDYTALSQLAQTGLVPGVEAPFPWGDDQYYVVAQQVLPLPTLGAYVAQQEEAWPWKARLQVADSLLDGIAQLHARGVIHRNLLPDNIYLDANASPPRVAITDFDFARITQADTIADSGDTLTISSPYRAPELDAAGGLGLAYADETTDLFAAGMILTTLFTGLDAVELRHARVQNGQAEEETVESAEVTIPELTTEDPYLTAAQLADLHAMLQILTAHEGPQRNESAAQARDLLRGILTARQTLQQASEAAALQRSEAEEAKGRKAAAVPGQAPPRRPMGELFVPGAIIANQYAVERSLGQGATANTYLVRDEISGEHFVLKQLRDPLLARQLAANEFRALHQLKHPGIVRVEDVRPPEDDFHLKMEYVEGYTLNDYKPEFPWKLEKATGIAEAVLRALEYLEEKQVAHRDLSARNIILTPEGQPKLIDFGFAAKWTAVGVSSVGTPLYRAPELDQGAGWPVSGDLYALGVLLYEMLTGAPPFSPDMNGRINKSVLPALPAPAPGNDTAQRIRQTLAIALTAIDPDPTKRFTSAEQFRCALHDAASLLPPVVSEGERIENGWVEGIQRLYRNSHIGNADNRGLDSAFARETYVPTRLDTELTDAILDGQYCIVLLSGNPGDGKTAFLERLCETLFDQDAINHSVDKNGWRYELKGRVFAANYDASESNKGRRANELLDAILEPLQGDQPPVNANYTALLAINDGKLRDFLLDNPRYGWLGEQVRRLLETAALPVDARVALVDLKQRSVVGGASGPDAGDLFERVLMRLLDADGWRACEPCRARASCPMRFNYDSLADPDEGASVRARLKTLFQITHLRRERHITMRDLRSALAYIVAGTTTCDQIHRELDAHATELTDLQTEEKARKDEEYSRASNRLYFQAAFNPEDEDEENLQDFAMYDPGKVAAPRLDRFLHFRRDPARMRDIVSLLRCLPNRSDAPLRDVNLMALGVQWYAAQKRRFYFEGDPAQIEAADAPLPSGEALLPYRHFHAFLAALRGETNLDALRDQLCAAISRANGIVAHTLNNQYLCVRTGHHAAQDITVFKRFPRDEFRCAVVPVRAEKVETLPNYLRFYHVEARIRAELTVSLDLFEILMRFTEGYQPGIEEQQPLVTDLIQFQNRLLNQRASELLLMEGGQRPHCVRQKDGIITLQPNDHAPSAVLT